MMKWVLLFLLLLVLFLLFCPVCYRVRLKPWQVSVEIRFLLCFTKKFLFPEPEEEEAEEIEAPPPESRGKAAAGERPAPKEQDEHSPEEGEKENLQPAVPEKPIVINPSAPAPEEEAAEEKEPSAEEAGEEESDEDEGPSNWELFRFALHNGTVGILLEAAGKCIRHSFPRSWRFYGRIGTGDPAETGFLEGLCRAFLGQAAGPLQFLYTERAFSVEGIGSGRIYPYYILWVLFQTAKAKPVREFWHYRQGRMHHE